MIQMIGIDLDGTLLTDRKELTRKTKEIMAEADRRGIIIVPTTGRPLFGVPAELRDLQGIRYAITSNGAVTYDLVNECALRGSYLSKDLALKILETVSVSDGIRSIYFNGFGYLEKRDMERLEKRFLGTEILTYLKKSRRVVEDIKKTIFDHDMNGIENISFMFPDAFALDETKRALADFLKGEHILQTYPTELEITAEGADKGMALVELAKYCGIMKEDIMGIGDSLNDLGLFESVGISVAMGNACDDVKRAAAFITKDNENDGAAAAIEKYAFI